MHPDLFQLQTLQEIDSQIREQADRIAAIPAAVADVEARRRELEDRLAKRKEGLEDARKKRRTLEGELEAVKAKLSKYNEQLMQVKTNDAYRAMLHEIEGTKKAVGMHEEKILEQMLLADELEGELKGNEKQNREAAAKLDQENARLEEQRREAEQLKADLEKERERVASAIDPLVRSAYDAVASTRNGIAVAGVRDELCLACRVKIRPQVFQEIRLGAELHQCDSCNRFLYYVESLPKPAADDAGDPALPSGGDAPAS